MTAVLFQAWSLLLVAYLGASAESSVCTPGFSPHEDLTRLILLPVFIYSGNSLLCLSEMGFILVNAVPRSRWLILSVHSSQLHVYDYLQNNHQTTTTLPSPISYHRLNPPPKNVLHWYQHFLCLHSQPGHLLPGTTISVITNNRPSKNIH